jgi:ATP synthase F1 delta subunit
MVSMNNIERTLARRYAQAFWHTFHESITLQTIAGYQRLITICKQKNDFYSILSIPLEEKDINNCLDQVAHTCTLSSEIFILIRLLLKHARIRLLDQVLFFIMHLYYQNHGILPIKVITSYVLDDKAQKIVENFLKEQFNAQPLCDFLYDPSLIVGIKLQTHDMIYEYSIKKKLEQAEKKLIKELV